MEMIAFKNVKDDEIENVSIKDSDSTTELNDRDSTTKNEKDLPPNSLLALLDDKNRSISLLKRQVHNQKLQLSFYLHRVLNCRKVIELSESCVPHETEENIQVNLAMSKFCKQVGLKSRIMDLHARMFEMEKRILRMTQQQEDMVRGIVTKLVELTKNGINDPAIIEFCTSLLRGDSDQVEVLSEIVYSTNKLRKELDTFRTCCNRLIVVEDERNTLVEQVYSMPVTQRMSYGVLVAAQYEKVRLEKEVQEIKQEQKILEERFSQLTTVNQCSQSTSSSPTSSEYQINVTKMMEAVNSEAITLLSVAKDHKDKYVSEISKLRDTNTVLVKQVACLQQVANEKEELEAMIDAAAREFYKIKENDQNKYNELNVRFQTVIEERDVLRDKLERYCCIDEQVKYLRAQVEDMDTIRKQRDYYKSQVEDLQAIRAAYAQLVEHCPVRGDKGENKEQTRKVQAELEKEREKMTAEIGSLAEVITDRESQIKHLLLIIQKLGTYKEMQKENQMRNSTNLMYSKDSGYTSESKSVYSQTDNNLQRLTLLKDLASVRRPRTLSPSDTLASSTTSIQTNTQDKATICDWNPDCFENLFNTSDSNCVLQNQHSSETLCDFMTTQEEEFSKDNSLSFQPPTPEPNKTVGTSQSFSGYQNPLISKTSVEVQSVNQEGKSESLKAILECSSPIEGVIQVNNATALSLRLTCGSASTQNKTETTSLNASLAPIISEEELTNTRDTSSRMKFATSVMDEFELMKDSSNETMVVTLPSLHRQSAGMVAMQCLEYTCNMQEETKESGLLGILNKDDEDVDVLIATNGNISDDTGNTDHENNENEAQLQEENNAKEIEDSEETKIKALTNRLKQITSELDQTLSKPGGKESLLNTVKLMYNTFSSGYTKN